MDKGHVIDLLRLHEPELREAGILHLRLFGSLARDEAAVGSDVDLMADIDRSKRLSLVGMVRLENRLSEILGRRADLAVASAMREPVRTRAMREAIHAF